MDFIYNRDYNIVVGNNGSGKTTLIQKGLIKSIPKDKVFVLNSSRQMDWSNYARSDHITKPIKFTTDYLEKYLLAVVSKHNNIHIVLDDVDNYTPRKSEIFKSVVINARHMGIGLTIATRSLQDIPILLYKQAKYVIFFRQSSQYVIQYIWTLIGEENAKMLTGLPEYSFAVWDSKTGKMTINKLSI